MRLACASALPAADFEAAPVLPSRSTFDASLATREDVCSLGEFFWVNALPAAAFDAVPVDLLNKTRDAALAALLPVAFEFMPIASKTLD